MIKNLSLFSSIENSLNREIIERNLLKEFYQNLQCKEISLRYIYKIKEKEDKNELLDSIIKEIQTNNNINNKVEINHQIFSLQLLLKKRNIIKNNHITKSISKIFFDEINILLTNEILNACIIFLRKFLEKMQKIKSIRDGFKFYIYRPMGNILNARFNREK